MPKLKKLGGARRARRRHLVRPRFHVDVDRVADDEILVRAWRQSVSVLANAVVEDAALKAPGDLDVVGFVVRRELDAVGSTNLDGDPPYDPLLQQSDV